MPESFADYDFPLPPSLIAQHPAAERDRSRMMGLIRGADALAHHRFADLPALLPAHALLVMNNTRVPPRRLTARLPTGVALEALLVAEEPGTPGLWRALVKKGRRLKPGMEVPFAAGQLPAQAVARTEDGGWLLHFAAPETLAQRLEVHGLAPLPPYIARDLQGAADPATAQADRAAYQTCYASVDGAIAAPTAGLHFTPAVLQALAARGIERAELTLHVGLGTFAKVQVDDPADHAMHAEWVHVPADTVARLRKARAQGRPVIAVGTTSVRALESWAAATSSGSTGTDATHTDVPGAASQSWQDWTRLYIRPGFRFQVVDGLITNFHLPKSTLLLMIAAFHGRERLLAAYGEAVRQAYRFFSFGDCMYIAPAGARGATDTAEAVSRVPAVPHG